MTKLLSSALVLLVAAGVATGAAAKSCKVFTTEVVGNTLVITGKRLASPYALPRVRLGNEDMVVNDATPEQVVVDIAALLDLLAGPKDFLLEIKPNRYDDKCDEHLVTFFPRDDAVPPTPPQCVVGQVSCVNPAEVCVDDSADACTGVGCAGICMPGAPL